MVFVTHFVSKLISYLLIVYLYFMHDGSRLGEANPNPNQSNQVLKVCNNYCTEVSPL